jgi:hypothetical protein
LGQYSALNSPDNRIDERSLRALFIRWTFVELILRGIKTVLDLGERIHG